MSIFFIVISVHRPFGGRPIGIVDRANQHAGDNLPAQSELVLAPAAHAFLAASAHDRIPIAVGFFLRVCVNLERDRLVEGECGAAVQPDERLTQHGEVHGQYVAGLASWIIGRRLVNRGHAAVRKCRGVEVRGFFGVLVEPQAGCHLDLACHQSHPFVLHPQSVG